VRYHCRFFLIVLLIASIALPLDSLAIWISVDPEADRYPSVSPYTYALNNPMKHKDPDGKIVETVVDIASVGFSAYDMYENPSWGNAGLLLLDLGGAMLPYVPAVGAVRHAGKIDNLVKGADKASDVAKKVPNPHGRKGGKAHQAGVEKAKSKGKADFEGQNTKVRTEGYIKTPGGEKSSRYGDVVVTKDGKIVKVYQVGDVLKDGTTPIARERRAIDDIIKQDIPVEFLPKE